jgi:hypothetical protein
MEAAYQVVPVEERLSVPAVVEASASGSLHSAPGTG